jgi:hypothetical protein
MSEHQGYSINYRISAGPQKGRKVFALQTLPAIQGDGQSGALISIQRSELYKQPLS